MTSGKRTPANEDSIAVARKNFDKIQAEIAKGVVVSKACNHNGVPVAAYQFVLNERGSTGTKTGNSGPETSREGSATPASATVPRPPPSASGAAAASDPSVGHSQRGDPSQVQGAGSEQTPGTAGSSGGYMAAAAGVSGPRPVTTVPQAPYQDIGPATVPERGGGPAILPGNEENLRQILRFAGLKEEDVNGICLAFLKFYDPEDFSKLAEMLVRTPLNKGKQQQVMEFWKNLMKPSNPHAGVGTSDDRLDAMMRRRGLLPEDEGADLEGASTDDLDRMERELKITRLRRDMQREKAELDEQMNGPASPTNPNSESMPVVLDINGQPVTMTIRKDQLHMYAKWIPGPNSGQGQTVPAGPPAKSPELIAAEEENKRLKEEAERKRLAEEAEARDKRFMEAMREMVKSIVPQQPAVNTEAERLKAELERERENRRAEENRRRDEELARSNEHQRKMDMRLQEMSQPGYWVRQRQDEMERAHAVGMISREEATRITEDDLTLKAKEKQIETQGAVQSRVGTIVADKLEGKGPLGKFVDKLASSPSVQAKAEALLEGGEPAVPAGGNAVAPPDAALIEAAKRAGAMGPDVPTPAGVN